VAFRLPVENSDIELRLVDPSGAPEVCELVLNNYEHLRPWLPWVSRGYSVESLLAFIKVSLNGYEKRSSLQTWIYKDNAIIGGIGFNTIDAINRSVEIGYWLSGSETGQGIMSDACRALIKCGFEEYGIHRIVIRCARENQKSQAIPIRLGFKREGVLRDAEWLHNRFVDLVIYSKLKVDN